MKDMYNIKAINRLKRSEGQIRGVLKMMEEGQSCKDVVTQLSAIHSSIDRAIGLIVAENLAECVIDAGGNDAEREQSIQEAINLIVKSR